MQKVLEPTKYDLITSPIGYFNKREITNQDPRALVVGSKNMLINDADKVATRKGFTLDGAAGSVYTGIKSSYDFISRNGKKILRSYEGATASTGKLQVRTEYVADTPLWVDLLTALAVADFSYTTWWYETESIRVLVFVDGTTKIRMWGGGLAYVASNAATTLTKSGTRTWAEEGFFVSTLATIGSATTQFDITNPSGNIFRYTWDTTGTDPAITASSVPVGSYVLLGGQNFAAGNNGLSLVTASGTNYFEITRAGGTAENDKTIGTGYVYTNFRKIIVVNGVTYAYTGGETTTTLTGLVGLPALTVGWAVLQGVVATTVLAGVSPMITPDVVMTKDNQIWYGDTDTSVIYGSKNTDYLDCAFTTPIRVPGEGFKIVLDSFTVGFTQDDDNVYVFAGLDDLYKITFTLSADQSKESITTKKLRAGAGQAALSQRAIISVKNGIMYFTNEKTLTWLTSIENVFTPQSLPTSDPIKDDFDSFDLTGATGIFFENAVWLAIPAKDLVYIYDFDKALWQPPQTIPIASFSIIKNETTQQNELYGHSNSSNETYKLNDGLDDNGVVIEFAAAFAYRQFGDRGVYKQFDEYFQEIYMSDSTTLVCTHRYEYQGSELIVIKEIDGSDAELLFAPASTVDSGLGKDELGKSPMGSTTVESAELNKYRCIHEMKLVDFFEHQIILSSDDENAQFEILSHGPNVKNSTNIPRSIKR